PRSPPHKRERETGPHGRGEKQRGPGGAPPPRRDRASRRTETRSNKQLPLTDNRKHTPAAKFPRTVHALELAAFPLPTTRPIPIRRPCQFRKAHEELTGRCSSAKTL